MEAVWPPVCVPFPCYQKKSFKDGAKDKNEQTSQSLYPLTEAPSTRQVDGGLHSGIMLTDYHKCKYFPK